MSRNKGTRLTDSPEFERAYRRGAAYRGKLFSVHAFDNEVGGARLGLSVSKKIGNAVTRNTVRRRLREMFRAAHPDVLGRRDIVISARPPASKATFEELEREFSRALSSLERPRSSEKT